MARKILVVDDDPMTRILLREFFEKRGCSVVEADDGDASYPAALSEQPDLITMDVEMGRIRGTSAALVIRESLETCRIPIILYSGIDPRDVASGIALDSRTRFIRKPGNLDKIWSAVQELAPDQTGRM